MSVCDYKTERENGLRVHVCTFLSTDWFIVRNCHSIFMIYKALMNISLVQLRICYISLFYEMHI